MLKSFWNFLFGGNRVLELTPYNFKEEFKELVPTGQSVIFILDLARYIETGMNISYTQVEILLFIMNYSKCPNLKDIEDYMSHVSEPHTRRLVKQLKEDGHLVTFEVDCDTRYRLSDKTLELINNYSYL
jgi:hypothetical protein